MKALILAAGVGSRLKEETRDIPKALVKVNGKPFLQYQLEALKANNITDVVIVIGHKGDKIRDFVAKFKDMNIKLVENPDYAKTNSATSFFLARDYVKHDSYIHLNCDGVFFPELIKRVVEYPKDNVIVVNKNVDLSKMTEHVFLDENDRIVRMSYKSEESEEPHGKGCGVAKISADALSVIIPKINTLHAKGEFNEWYYGVIRNLLDKKEFYGVDLGGSFIREVNTTEDLEEANKAVEELK